MVSTKEVKELAKELMLKHDLQDYQFSFCNTKSTIGRCNNAHKTIEYSIHFLHATYEDIKDTILHEIAHALSFKLYGYKGIGHNKYWKRTAQSIGCKPNRCGDTAPILKGTYTMRCSNCGRTHEFYRAIKRLDRACALCCRKYNNGRYDERFKMEVIKNK